MAGPTHATLSPPRTRGPRAVAAPMRRKKYLGRGRAQMLKVRSVRGHTISGRESGHFNGLRRHFRAARPAVTHDGDRDASVREIDGRLYPTELRRARGAPRPNRSAATGGSVASSAALRNGFDGTGQRALLRGCGGSRVEEGRG